MKPASCGPEPSFSGWGEGGPATTEPLTKLGVLFRVDEHAQRPAGKGDVVMDGGSPGRLAAAALSPENGKEGPEKIEGWGCSAEPPSRSSTI